jgi:hypothetical protein
LVAGISSPAAHKNNFRTFTVISNYTRFRGFHKNSSIISKHIFEVQVGKACIQDYDSMFSFNSQLTQEKQKFWGKRKEVMA